MDEFLDILWAKIVVGIHHIVAFMDYILSPLNALGPGPVILILVLITVCFTKAFSRVYTTKRYRKLQKEFTHWFKLRQEALACEDREKGRLLAKNIDQAQLNRVYYDYFFEGLLKNILTTYLPILLMAAYVNETYRPENLIKNFGRAYIFKFSNLNGEPVVIGGLFWFVVSLLMTYLFWYVIEKIVVRRKKSGQAEDASGQPSRHA